MPKRRRVKKEALGRSRGVLTSKWHIAVDTFGRPVRFILTGGNVSDVKLAIPLMAGLDAHHVLADKAYDSLDHIEASGARPIIPQRICMPCQRDFDPAIYRLRNRIERTISKFKQIRRVATRYDRLPHNSVTSHSLRQIIANGWISRNTEIFLPRPQLSYQSIISKQQASKN